MSNTNRPKRPARDEAHGTCDWCGRERQVVKVVRWQGDTRLHKFTLCRHCRQPRVASYARPMLARGINERAMLVKERGCG